MENLSSKVEKGIGPMSTRFHAAGETISRLGALEWFKLRVKRHPDLGHLQVPYIGWRFAEPSEAKLRYVEDAVRATPTQVAWRVDTSRRNWLLAPSVILGEGANPAASPGFDERVEAARRDPVFCAQAWDDLDAIVRTLGGFTAAREDSLRG
ncbi:hypothetical protein ACFVVP_06640 [Streptomyces sp. NPDC058128]|uniref:hypothetical protein n=1 Tax=Streptomyces sp. NPDC058128 TaxID=3346352 RepID=UPI0036E4B37C